VAEIAFGTDGWRSTVNKDFNRENVTVVARAICNYLHNKGMAGKGCVVAYDTRAHSEPFADLVSAVLVRNGIRALKTATFCPTPTAAFAVQQTHAAGAIMLTASHNPPEYNGIKFIPHYAGPATPDITDDIEVEIDAVLGGAAGEASGSGPGAAEIVDVADQYVEQLLRLVDSAAVQGARARVAFDPMYGAGQQLFMTALQRMDCEVSPLHCRRDPQFGGRLPDPSEQNLGELRQAVSDNRALIGVALDGDADRFGVIDSKGTYLTANQALSLILWYLLEHNRKEGDVARTLATTHMLDTIAEHYGREVIETPVGFKYIGELMRARPIVMGGEESGGMSVIGHIPEKDGLLAGLLLVEIAVSFKKPLSDLLQDIYHQLTPCFDERIDVPLPNQTKSALMRSLKARPPERLAGEAVQKVDLRDGVKVITGAGAWMLVRPSGTEPLVRVYVEARSRQAFDNVRDSALKIVEGD
jgi:alpha-D-glucose phosphate-specific phosphoglucomutase